MPEGPELHFASLFVNRVCSGVVFSGAVEKSEVSKRPHVPFACDAYSISAVSRGKEVRLTLTPIKSETKSKVKEEENQTPMDVVFRFGMSGSFRFTAVDELPKHAHVRFYTKEDPQRVLSFVDTRRFGSWQHNATWQKDRGPCVMSEYESFRQNVLSNLSDKAFNRPICEALLNQKYFNGIGNYLRAEILYRMKIPPFVKARTVLEGLAAKNEDTKEVKVATANTNDFDSDGKRKVETKGLDILSLCHIVPLEVISLGEKGYEPEKGNYTELEAWFQCYGVNGMNSINDHNGRNIWFQGSPGPMAPKGSNASRTKRKIQKVENDYTDTKKAAKKEHTGSVSKGTHVQEASGTVKNQKGQRGTRRQKTRLDTQTHENKKPKTSKKHISAGPHTSRAKNTRRQMEPEGNITAKRIRRSQRLSSTAAF
ncbi:endonuclease 8-like 1 [Hoplias malabaricus]|uniref:endonuclease 8-like 1 n=1 Tax=Hoplias malabaricus TaxID=27720 RepID=UPI00346339E3